MDPQMNNDSQPLFISKLLDEKLHIDKFSDELRSIYPWVTVCTTKSVAQDQDSHSVFVAELDSDSRVISGFIK